MTPSDRIDDAHLRRGLYRHALAGNPSMMYFYTVTDYFIPDIDVTAFLLFAYVCEDAADVLPPRREMMTRNRRERLDELDVPYLRKDVDESYRAELFESLPDDHWYWTEDRGGGFDEYLMEGQRQALKVLARDMITGGHGGGFGTYDSLSARGEDLASQYVSAHFARSFALAHPSKAG